MSALQPVSFRMPAQRQPRLSTPYVPGKTHERFWSAKELDTVKHYYPKGGTAACLAHLGPHRTPSGVYQQASKLGLRAPAGTASDKTTAKKAEKIAPPAGFNEALRAFYQEGDGKKRGECNAFADSWNLPRWWVTKRATALGLVLPHKKEPPWTRAEEALMAKVPLHDVNKCAEIFRQHGFNRSPTAIMVKAKRLNLSRRYKATFSATGAARVLGVDIKWITSEILRGALRAEKRPTKRLAQQGGDPWSIERASLRAYIIEHLGRVDMRKVDKFAFVDVLCNDGAAPAPAKKSDGRKSSWTPERRAAQSRRMRKRWRKGKR